MEGYPVRVCMQNSMPVRPPLSGVEHNSHSRLWWAVIMSLTLRIQWPSRRLKETRWQVFARAKGITKRRRSRLVWSDVARDWVPRWGARSSHAREEAAHTSAGVVELPGESTFLGRLGRVRGVRKLGKRVKKELQKPPSALNVGKSAGGKQRAVKQSRETSELDPFASRKLRTAKQKLREVRGQLEGQAKGKPLPPGVLAVLGNGERQKVCETISKSKLSLQKKNHRGQTREELKEVLGRAQVSTASFGTFDRLAKNEKKEKQKASSKGKSTSLKEEQGAYLKQLKQVLHNKSSSTT